MTREQKTVLSQLLDGVFAQHLIGDQDARVPSSWPSARRAQSTPSRPPGKELCALFAWKQEDVDYMARRADG